MSEINGLNDQNANGRQGIGTGNLVSCHIKVSVPDL